jgi:transcriptional regulator GlxA family with amidase domain
VAWPTPPSPAARNTPIDHCPASCAGRPYRLRPHPVFELAALRRWGKSNGRPDKSRADAADILLGIAVLETPWHAAAGVLDGRRAATHWLHAPLLATRHPQVAVEPDAIFVRDGSVWSSAGVTTGIDLALALIEEDAGRQVAMNVARMLVVYLKRTGGQSQYSALLAAQVQSESETFDSLDRWIAEHLNDDLRVNALAEQVHMSPRNFARAYAEKRGRTPAKAVEAIRVEAARRRLEETEDRVESVAEDTGFSNEEQMRCSFIRILGIPPREYRKRFATIV